MRRSHFVDQVSIVWRRKLPHLPDFADILEDLDILTAHLVSVWQNTAVWRKNFETGLWINLVIHRLLHLQTTGLRSVIGDGKRIQECLRLAALLYAASARWDYGLPCPQEVNARRVWKPKAYAEEMDEVEWEELFSLRLWVLVIGAINTGVEGGGASPERMWVVNAIVRMFETIGLASLRQVERVLKGFLWIEELMWEDANVLW